MSSSSHNRVVYISIVYNSIVYNSIVYNSIVYNSIVIYSIVYTPNLPTNIVDFRGFDSSRILILRGGIRMSIWSLPECYGSAPIAVSPRAENLQVHRNNTNNRICRFICSLSRAVLQSPHRIGQSCPCQVEEGRASGW